MKRDWKFEQRDRSEDVVRRRAAREMLAIAKGKRLYHALPGDVEALLTHARQFVFDKNNDSSEGLERAWEQLIHGPLPAAWRVVGGGECNESKPLTISRGPEAESALEYAVVWAGTLALDRPVMLAGFEDDEWSGVLLERFVASANPSPLRHTCPSRPSTMHTAPSFIRHFTRVADRVASSETRTRLSHKGSISFC